MADVCRCLSHILSLTVKSSSSFHYEQNKHKHFRQHFMTIFHQNFYLCYNTAVVTLSHTDPSDLSHCSRLDLPQVTDSNLPHTDFWDDPLLLTIVPKIICSHCSWESRDASSSWSLRFMNSSRCFPQCSQLDLWRVCQRGPSRAKLSRAEPSRAEPSRAWQGLIP